MCELLPESGIGEGLYACPISISYRTAISNYKIPDVPDRLNCLLEFAKQRYFFPIFQNIKSTWKTGLFLNTMDDVILESRVAPLLPQRSYNWPPNAFAHFWSGKVNTRQGIRLSFVAITKPTVAGKCLCY